MPLDKNPETTDSTTETARPRRRATRKAAAPQPAEKLDVLAELAPTSREATSGERVSARERTEAQLNAALDLASASHDASAKPARKRATRSAGTPEPIPADASEPPTRRATRARATRRTAAPDAAATTTEDTATKSAATRKSTATKNARAKDAVEAGAATDAPAATKPARTRKATTRKTPAKAAPEAVAPELAETVPDVSVEAAGASAATDDPAEKAPARRTRRSSTTARRATAEPVATEPVAAEATVPDETSSSPEPAPETTKVPAKRTARRTASKKSAPAVEAEANSVDAPQDAVVQEAAAPDETETRPAARRRRATRSRGAANPEAGASAPADAAPETTTTEATTTEPTTASEAAGTPERQTTSRPRLAATAVLFQAPDLAAARPKRRRVSAPAGSPDEVRAGVHVDETAAPAEPGAEPTPEELTEDEALAAAESAQAETADGGPADVEAADTEEVAPAEGEEIDEEAEDDEQAPRRRRRRGGRGRRHRGGNGGDETGDEASNGREDAEAEPTEEAAPGDDTSADEADADDEESGGSSRRRRRRRRGGGRGTEGRGDSREQEGRTRSARNDEVTALKGSTRLEAKRQRRRDGRDAGRRRQIITEAEFLARRESVERSMIVRERGGRTQIAVLEDGVLVEHYVSQQEQASMAGNVYLGRVQNVLPSMEAAFVDIGKGRNAVLYAGEVNWDAAGLSSGQPRRIEQALRSGDSVLVQVTKDPIGQKGARLTSQVTLAGRYLVYVPGGGMTGISRKLPETERTRLKRILREVVPDGAGVIVRTAAEGASEEELTADIARLRGQWEAIEKKSRTASAPALLQGEPDLSIRVVRDIFNDDFSSLVVSGKNAWTEISDYVGALAPDLADKVTRWTSEDDVFAEHRIDEQLAKGLDRKVYLPSGGSLVIDRTEAMTVVDVNTGKFTGAGGTLEETVTRNNLEAAEEIVRQLRLRDIGGIVVIDFIDMVLESNRDLVLRRLVECLGRDRTKHQVAEVTSLGLVQMTRKRVGQGLVEAFSETCEHCHGRGFIVHDEPIERGGQGGHQHSGSGQGSSKGSSKSGSKGTRSGKGSNKPEATESEQAPAETTSKRSRRRKSAAAAAPEVVVPVLPEERSEAREAVKATLAQIAAAAQHAHDADHDADSTPEA